MFMIFLSLDASKNFFGTITPAEIHKLEIHWHLTTKTQHVLLNPTQWQCLWLTLHLVLPALNISYIYLIPGQKNNYMDNRQFINISSIWSLFWFFTGLTLKSILVKKKYPNSFKNDYKCRKEKFVELLTKKYYAKMINFGRPAVFSTRTFLRRAIFVVPL